MQMKGYCCQHCWDILGCCKFTSVVLDPTWWILMRSSSQ